MRPILCWVFTAYGCYVRLGHTLIRVAYARTATHTAVSPPDFLWPGAGCAGHKSVLREISASGLSPRTVEVKTTGIKPGLIALRW